MRKLKPVSVSSYFGQRGTSANRLLERSTQLQRLSRIVWGLLGTPWDRHCRVANIRDETLVLAVDSPAWSSKLRFQSPQILRSLERDHQLRFKRIQVLVTPIGVTRDDRNGVRRQLSDTAGQLILQTAECVDDPGLSAALKRLAKRARNG